MAPEKEVHHRSEIAEQEERHQHAPDHHNGQGALRLRTIRVEQCGGQEPEDRREPGHQDRPQAVRTSFHNGLVYGLAVKPQAVKRGNQEQPVHDGDAKDRDEPHRGRDAEIRVCQQ